MSDRRRVSRRILLCALAAIATSCGDDSPTTPYAVPGSPTTCFTMTGGLVSDPYCRQLLQFTLDASCSTDDRTPSASLEVRWDYENDGTWDTPFSTIKVDQSFQPDPAPSNWTARAEVKDADGKTTVATMSLATGPFPTSPDLIAKGIDFRLFSSTTGVDTVHVNEDFSVMVLSTCYGNFTSAETRILQDGVAVDSLGGSCTGGLYGCGGSGHSGWLIGAPGTYVFTAILDSDGENAETNEINNTIRDTLVVIP